MKINWKGIIAIGIYLVVGILVGVVLGFIFGDAEGDVLTPAALIIIAAALVFLAVRLSGRRKKTEAKAQRELQRKAERENLDTAKLDSIIEYIRSHSEKTVFKISTAEESCAADDSKFGGYPLWPRNEEYPQSPGGEKLVLLAQINYTKEHFNQAPLPDEGILQIFVRDDDYVGCNFFGEEYEKDNFRVVYHRSVSDPLSPDEMKEMGIPSTLSLDSRQSCFPFFSERKMIFSRDTDYISSCVSGFDELAAKALKELFGEEIEGSVSDQFNYTEYEYLSEPFDSFGHKLLGYPAFTQTDPRAYAEDSAGETNKCNTLYYDTVLLQADSQDDQMWGDCGVANFFINSSALENLDFSDVFYTWDCC